MFKQVFQIACMVMLAAATIVPAAAEHGTSAADRQFVQNAAMSGTQEVRQGQIEMRSGDANARQFAARMVQDHTKANKQLALLAQELGLTPALKRGIAMAPAAATVPPREYLVSQVSAHQDAITLFEREATKGQNSSLRAFARMALPTLRAHLELAQRLTGTP